jgi:hypothetical protein
MGLDGARSRWPRGCEGSLLMGYRIGWAIGVVGALVISCLGASYLKESCLLWTGLGVMESRFEKEDMNESTVVDTLGQHRYSRFPRLLRVVPNSPRFRFPILTNEFVSNECGCGCYE